MNKGSILKIVLIIIAIILVLSYFGVDIKSFIESPGTQRNIHYVWDGIVNFWEHYLKGPFMVVFNFFLQYIWYPAIHGLTNMSQGQPIVPPGGVPTTLPPQ